ncbi:hypothetical protein H6F89_30725 [Cyanobacteria bacterium FACHB-63]|nr:hypothetical protein [Cyanobacteria bacterium FACHB-63]
MFKVDPGTVLVVEMGELIGTDGVGDELDESPRIGFAFELHADSAAARNSTDIKDERILMM